MTGSVYVLTFHKAGSQWVRDVLWEPEVLAHLGIERGVSGAVARLPRPNDEAGDPIVQLHAPVYTVGFRSWITGRRPGEKAVVVVRDPRDLVVSFLPSVLLSHREVGEISRLRPPLRALESREQLIASLIWLQQRVPALREWAERSDSDVELVTSYEALVADERQAFGNIVEFLGGDRHHPDVVAAVARHSFTARSGRRPGETDAHSHYRRGVAGDWRNHFDHTTGELFEGLFPGLLTSLGYEDGPDWWTDLPAAITPVPAVGGDDQELLVELRRVQEENLLLRRVCDERLTLINDLDVRLRDAKAAAAPAPDNPSQEDDHDHLEEDA